MARGDVLAPSFFLLLLSLPSFLFQVIKPSTQSIFSVDSDCFAFAISRGRLI